jgi:hypothetical protein
VIWCLSVAIHKENCDDVLSELNNHKAAIVELRKTHISPDYKTSLPSPIPLVALATSRFISTTIARDRSIRSAYRSESLLRLRYSLTAIGPSRLEHLHLYEL